jgi:HEPN domain-containing protein
MRWGRESGGNGTFDGVDSLTAADLEALAAARLQDAEALLAAGRYDASRYICGYAVELRLKARICRAHGWATYPPAAQLAQALKTHNLEVLLLLSTLHARIIGEHGEYWSAVVAWNPEQRYVVTALTAQDAQKMIDATGALMAFL